MSLVVANPPSRPRPAPAAAHVPGLDGVRGLAVAAVVAYHLGFGWAKGGYLGVDTFLVLSGYLITAGLLAEHGRSGRVELGAFWARRVRRLLPALLLLVAVIGVYAAMAALPDEARSLRLDGVSALGFFSNWRFVVSAQGYFGRTAAPSLLLHTWSLGVEAQLYLVWPLVTIAVLARWGHRALSRVALLLAAASAAAGVLLAHGGGAQATGAYYGTDTRAEAFLLGAAVAAALAGRRARGGTRYAGAGVAGMAITAVLWASLSGTSPWLWRGGLPLAAVATAVIVVDVVVRPLGWAARVLSMGPLRGLGRVSYGVYLWHWPLLLLLDTQRTGLTGPALLALRLAATAAATAASWVLVERPILSGGWRRLRLGSRPAIAMIVASAMVAGLVLAPVARGASAADRKPPVASAPPHFVPVGLSAAPRPLAVAPGTVPALVFGDSVAFTLGYGMVPIAGRYGVDLDDAALIGCGVALGSALRVSGGAGPVPTPCDAWATDWQSWVQMARPAVSIILLGRWEVLDRRIDGRWQHAGQPGFDEYLSAQLDRAIGIAGSTGATVIVCTAPYFQGAERPQGGRYPEDTPGRVDRFNQVVRAEVARHPGVILFDLNGLVSPGGRYAATIDGRAIRSSDGVHFTSDGSGFVAARLLPLVDQVGRRRAATVTAAPGGTPK